MKAVKDRVEAEKAAIESKYPSYADYPGVPDAGTIIGRSLSRSEAGTASWSKGMTHYYYRIAENPTFSDSAWIEWQALIDFDPLYDKYADALVECGFSEHFIKTYGGSEWGFTGNGWIVFVHRSGNAFVVVVQPDA